MLIKVTDENIKSLDIYSSFNEVQLKRINEPEPGIFIAETPNVIMRAIKAGYEPVSFLIDERLFSDIDTENSGSEAGELRKTVSGILSALPENLPVYTASNEILSKISGFKQTRGVLAAMKRKPLPSLQETIKGAKRIAVLENVENPTNAGAIFRSAAGLGFDAVILTYRSADPLYRRAARVSMGTVFQLPWTFSGSKHEDWNKTGLQELKDNGFCIISMALSERAVFLDRSLFREKEKLAVIFGNEETGITKETLNKSDFIVKIPMKNGVDSLNVAAASAVTFWELRN